MKLITKYMLFSLSLLGTSIIVFAQVSSPPGLPPNPVGVVPWNSELLTGAGILLSGIYCIIKNKIKK